MEEEDYMDDDFFSNDLNEDSDIAAVVPFAMELTDEFYEIHLFLTILLMFFFESIGLPLLVYFVMVLHIRNFERDLDDEDPTADINDAVIESLYSSGFEIGAYT